VNAPGFYYQRKSATVVRALPCPVDTFSKGLDKATACTPCKTDWKTDPDAPAGSATSGAACGEWHTYHDDVHGHGLGSQVLPTAGCMSNNCSCSTQPIMLPMSSALTSSLSVSSASNLPSSEPGCVRLPAVNQGLTGNHLSRDA